MGLIKINALDVLLILFLIKTLVYVLIPTTLMDRIAKNAPLKIANIAHKPSVWYATKEIF